MVDIMNSNRKNALEKIYTPLLTFRRSFRFSKKNDFLINDIFKESKYFITLIMIKCGKKKMNHKFFKTQIFLIFMI